MPPKRKAASKAKTGGKKVKVEPKKEEEKISTVKDAIEQLKAADNKKVFKAKKDAECSIPGSVFQDYDCMLNQTNIGNNNNKFYVIQVVEGLGGQFYSWCRWGRVGERGMNKLLGPMEEEEAVKDFKKKFKEKTKNQWEDRGKFVPVPGKYTLIEMHGDDDGDNAGDQIDSAPITSSGKVGQSKLDPPTQDLVKMIFDNDMFKGAMQSMNIDVKKMPLGKLSKAQIAKGFESLEKLEEAINDRESVQTLRELSSEFYTRIPHSFGRSVPPTIDNLETVRQKMDMLLVLGDIELTLSLQKDKDKASKDLSSDHPLDINYSLLKCGLEHVDPKSKDFDIIKTYTEASHSGSYKPKVLDVWKVNRAGEDERFSVNDKISHRKLLWHGTNVAVVAAILKSGLRIMPHSGGRVGAGIYFASENNKSLGYVRPTSDGVGVMFLNEVALGKEKDIVMGDGSLKKAPPGYDSIVARGRQEPDPKSDVILTLDKKKVIVPKGKPKNTTYKDSSFHQSEYLVYREDQCRIRYLIKLKQR